MTFNKCYNDDVMTIIQVLQHTQGDNDDILITYVTWVAWCPRPTVYEQICMTFVGTEYILNMKSRYDSRPGQN